MTPDEAIAIFKDMRWDLSNPYFPKSNEALELGIEALQEKLDREKGGKK